MGFVHFEFNPYSTLSHISQIANICLNFIYHVTIVYTILYMRQRLLFILLSFSATIGYAFLGNIHNAHSKFARSLLSDIILAICQMRNRTSPKCFWVIFNGWYLIGRIGQSENRTWTNTYRNETHLSISWFQCPISHLSCALVIWDLVVRNSWIFYIVESIYCRLFGFWYLW